MSWEEIDLARHYAAHWSPLNSKKLRRLVSRATHCAYIGERTIDSFIHLFKTLVIDEGDHFSNKNIDMRLYFINSMKSQDIDLQCLKESKRQEDQLKIPTRKANLTAMGKALLNSSLLTVGDCKLHFSTCFLEMLKVISGTSIFDRRLIRLNTDLLYKQDKFNLLREDTVGYSVLINDIIIGSIDVERDQFGQLQATPLDRVPVFLDIISSHIGNFHLDPNRVLDILLDVFVKEVLINYVFWIELFKESVWIRQLTQSSLGGNDDKNRHTSTNINYSITMAQLLGFKFEHYHHLEKSRAPDELYYVCALLIKYGLIRLGDLLSYLAPNEDCMEKLKNDYMENMNKEIKNNSGGLLAQYGALGDEGTTAKSAKSSKPANDVDDGEDGAGHTQIYNVNDVVELVKALLSIGDLLHSEELLAKYSKLCDMYPILAHYIYRLCNAILEPVYQMYLPDYHRSRSHKILECAQQSELKSVFPSTKDEIPTLPKLTTYFVLDALKDGMHDLKKKQMFCFFYTRWTEQLGIATSYDHLLTHLMPVMRLAGYHAYLAPHLIHKLIRVLLTLFQRGEVTPESPQRHVCITMIREFILPAVAFSGANPGLTTNVWKLLDLLTLQERYCLYGEWGTDFYKQSIETKLLKARVARNVKSVMRRISKNDTRPCGRELGKLTHSNPTIVFSVMLDQIQVFDNLAPYMADACRYMNNFSYDILGYFMTEKWTGYQDAGLMKKIKLKKDGITSSWLRALSVFSGMLFKKQGIDPTPLIRYMIFRLQHDDSVTDLVLFNEFITKVCGIEIIGSTLTDDQITSSGCSNTLKYEAFIPISNDNKKATKRVITRLKNTLKKDNAALELLVLLYRLSESCSSLQGLSTQERVKRLNYVQQTILQYYELLTTIFEEAEYCALVPSVNTLYKDYDLPYPIVMQIMRPKIQYLLRNNMGLDTNYDEIPSVLQPLVQATSSMMKNDGVFEMMTPEFFVIFWQLGLYDVHCPVKHYETAMKRYADQIAQCQDPQSSLNQSNKPSAVSKMERQAQVNLDALNVDLPKHKQVVENTVKMLKTFCSRWFVEKVNPLLLNRYILQYCLYPRSVMSEVDAVYCYKFTMLMHHLNASNFSSLNLIDQILCEDLPTTLITFTDYETTIHARFIFKLFSKISQWYKNETLFNDEAHGSGLIGFQQKWIIHESSQKVAPKQYLLSHSDFIMVVGKWHNYTTQFLEQALTSGDSHQIRNAFLILRQFIPHFPTIRKHGSILVAATKLLAATEKRDDLKVLARSYLGLIERSKSRWVNRNAFLGLPEFESPPPTQAAASSSGSSKQYPIPTTHSKSTSPQHLHGDRDKNSEKPSSSRNMISSAVSSSNKTASTLIIGDRKRPSKEDINPRPLLRSNSNNGTDSNKRPRSDYSQPYTPHPSNTCSTGNSNTSDIRPRHTDLSPIPSSFKRHPPKPESSRGVDDAAVPIPTILVSKDDSRFCDKSMDIICKSASRSDQPCISTSLPSQSSTTTRELQRSTSKDDRHRNSSRDHHQHRDEKQNKSDISITSTFGSQPSSSSSASSSTVLRHKRPLQEEDEASSDHSNRSSKYDKRYQSYQQRSIDQLKNRSGKDHRDKKRSRK